MPASEPRTGGGAGVSKSADATDDRQVEAAAFESVAVWGREALSLSRELKGVSPRAVETKADAFDLTTPADAAIERRLRERIARAFPTHAVIGEEQGSSDGPHDWQWVLDPIDGTFNYFTNLPGAACSIALRRGTELRVGAVVDFTSGVVFRARVGGGVVSDDGPRTSQHTAAGRARLFLEWGSERMGEFEVDMLGTLARVRPIVPRLIGGAAFALLSVALEGGCFVGLGLRLWDVAAGVVLAQEAGHRARWWYGSSPVVHVLVGTESDVEAFAPVVAELARRSDARAQAIA